MPQHPLAVTAPPESLQQNLVGDPILQPPLGASSPLEALLQKLVRDPESLTSLLQTVLGPQELLPRMVQVLRMKRCTVSGDIFERNQGWI